MNAETPGPSGQFHHWRWRFQDWRGGRPFWAGLLTTAGGVPIALLPYVNIQLGNMTLAMATTAGAGSLIIGVLLVTLGLTMWFQAAVRIFAGVAAILLALVSLPVSNLGGFMAGFLLSMIGGALAISWAPGTPVEEQERKREQEPGPERPEPEHHAYASEPGHPPADSARYAPAPGVPLPPERPARDARGAAFGTNAGRRSAG